MKELQCDGECARWNACEGDVVKVHSWDGKNLRTGQRPTCMEFNYCATARSEDRKRGFDVEEV